MNYLWYFILFGFGAAIGSFLNVVSLRYKIGGKICDLKNIGGRSHCRNCGKTLEWYELVPIFSFLIQKGKCRSCKGNLLWQYPLVEFLSALVFVLVPFVLINKFQLAFSGFELLNISLIGCWILVFEIFILLSIIDFWHYIIPDEINLTLGFLGIIILGITNLIKSPFTQFYNNSFLRHYSLILNFAFIKNYINNDFIFSLANHFLAAFIVMVFFGLIIIISRGRGMGWGDFKLVGALGLIFGWPDVLLIVFLSFIIGTIAVLPLLVKKEKTMKDAVPFGPFLILGATLLFFLGFQIIDNYFKLFNIYLLF